MTAWIPTLWQRLVVLPEPLLEQAVLRAEARDDRLAVLVAQAVERERRAAVYSEGALPEADWGALLLCQEPGELSSHLALVEQCLSSREGVVMLQEVVRTLEALAEEPVPSAQEALAYSDQMKVELLLREMEQVGALYELTATGAALEIVQAPARMAGVRGPEAFTQGASAGQAPVADAELVWHFDDSIVLKLRLIGSGRRFEGSVMRYGRPVHPRRVSINAVQVQVTPTGEFHGEVRGNLRRALLQLTLEGLAVPLAAGWRISSEAA
jgi:hypothetical protein